MCVLVLVPDLCGTDDGLAGRVAASNHHLLGDEDFLSRDLNPKVAPGNHHAITLSQDLLKTDRAIRGVGDEKGEGFRVWDEREGVGKEHNRGEVSRDEKAEAEGTKTILFVSVHDPANACKCRFELQKQDFAHCFWISKNIVRKMLQYDLKAYPQEIQMHMNPV